ncbi:methyltransferase family protein [Roseospira goensis]|uniref:Protein-S-isoprenylcysteine O-methyltransferase Ste14 n=1 Tax=Roseospira goensis TaxID=391922 RepID=A0A7W6S379_9PROT|nr:isoprenylcysteine carboxylmethyltransferase family protein [Roseospira goensis]MBB4287349.1 protein-S-isoprenylcysteine O-methyltransferase Ste14 [Roseospira goensis]
MIGLHLAWPGAVLLGFPLTLAGLLPMALGFGLAAAAKRRFDHAGADVRPFAKTPALVTDGPFRVSRNPMYLGLVLATAGVAVLLGTLTPWLGPILLAVWLDVAFARREERHMQALFGADYAAYRARVRRWI